MTHRSNESNKRFAFIFDMDGVLVDNMRLHARSWVELFNDYGLEGMEPERYLRETAGMKGLDVLRHFLRPDITPAEADHLTELKDFLYRVMYRREMQPMPGLEAFLALASESDIGLGVGTGAGAKNIEFTLERPPFRERFEAVVGSHQVRRGKPHPDIFLRVAELLGVPASRCVVFEDALPGIEAANAAGMKSIALSTTNPAKIMGDLPGVMAVIGDFTGITPSKVLEKLHEPQSTER